MSAPTSSSALPTPPAPLHPSEGLDHSRARGIFGDDGLASMHASRVLVAGCADVGADVARILALSGIGAIFLCDHSVPLNIPTIGSEAEPSSPEGSSPESTPRGSPESTPRGSPESTPSTAACESGGNASAQKGSGHADALACEHAASAGCDCADCTAPPLMNSMGVLRAARPGDSLATIVAAQLVALGTGCHVQVVEESYLADPRRIVEELGVETVIWAKGSVFDEEVGSGAHFGSMFIDAVAADSNHRGKRVLLCEARGGSFAYVAQVAASSYLNFVGDKSLTSSSFRVQSMAPLSPELWKSLVDATAAEVEYAQMDGDPDSSEPVVCIEEPYPACDDPDLLLHVELAEKNTRPASFRSGATMNFRSWTGAQLNTDGPLEVVRHIEGEHDVVVKVCSADDRDRLLTIVRQHQQLCTTDALGIFISGEPARMALPRCTPRLVFQNNNSSCFALSAPAVSMASDSTYLGLLGLKALQLQTVHNLDDAEALRRAMRFLDGPGWQARTWGVPILEERGDYCFDETSTDAVRALALARYPLLLPGVAGMVAATVAFDVLKLCSQRHQPTLMLALADARLNRGCCQLPPAALRRVMQDANVLIVGSGAVGCEMVKNLALLGVRHITLADNDTVSGSNLPRQFFFRKGDVGEPKARVVSKHAAELFGIAVTPIAARLDTRSFLPQLCDAAGALRSGSDVSDTTDSAAMDIELNVDSLVASQSALSHELDLPDIRAVDCIISAVDSMAARYEFDLVAHAISSITGHNVSFLDGGTGFLEGHVSYCVPGITQSSRGEFLRLHANPGNLAVPCAPHEISSKADVILYALEIFRWTFSQDYTAASTQVQDGLEILCRAARDHLLRLRDRETGAAHTFIAALLIDGTQHLRTDAMARAARYEASPEACVAVYVKTPRVLQAQDVAHLASTILPACRASLQEDANGSSLGAITVLTARLAASAAERPDHSLTFDKDDQDVVEWITFIAGALCTAFEIPPAGRLDVMKIAGQMQDAVLPNTALIAAAMSLSLCQLLVAASVQPGNGLGAAQSLKQINLTGITLQADLRGNAIKFHKQAQLPTGARAAIPPIFAVCDSSVELVAALQRLGPETVIVMRRQANPSLPLDNHGDKIILKNLTAAYDDIVSLCRKSGGGVVRAGGHGYALVAAKHRDADTPKAAIVVRF
eukprot:m.19831 g.19831  ORF g.19831 m.19831 type:complete len:1173 (-) comp3474_c0_seq1:117-3635(-)